MKQMNKFLALGDSYTIGESVNEQERWPVQLSARLQQDGYNIQNPRIIATTGWTTGELMNGIRAEGLNEKFDLVSLLIGVNNQYRGYSIEEYRLDFEELLKMAIMFAGGKGDKVFVLSIPDYGVTPFASDLDSQKVAKEIDEFNFINKKVSDAFSVSYFDITPISRTAKADSSLIASDGLHPSGAMYKMWVDLIYPSIKEKLIR